MSAKRPRGITVLSLGLEGGDCKIMGREGPDGWVFWQAGTSMDIDLDDNETWRSFKTEPVPSLAEALPVDWWLFYPLTVHKDFVGRVREEYDRTEPARAKRRRQRLGFREHLDSVAAEWREALG